MHGRHLAQIGPKFSSVAHGNLDLLRRRKRRFPQAGKVGHQPRLHFVMIESERIKLDQQRAIGGMEITKPLNGFGLQQMKQLQHALMAVERDVLAKRNKKRLVACGSELRGTRCCVAHFFLAHPAASIRLTARRRSVSQVRLTRSRGVPSGIEERRSPSREIAARPLRS